ncbi:contractile injection system protein, VgrG/Pvc8 family [Pseudoalteromonas sp. S1727]|uniref:contractile injection system protein, VgrG/Pvc8 family n=1 Tax=Pseudoalteromonas sp. S1727 TaxID=2066514 RepID=UPI002015F3D7|nr:contractile injection system protein, VgrG/Pvc8 family [Pseudoalteromonas sp. S1727]
MSQSRLLLDVNNKTMNVTQVNGIERLNNSFTFDLIFDTPYSEEFNDLTSHAALITFVNKDNYYRHQSGLITQCTDLGLYPGQKHKKRRYRVIVQDRLSTLKTTTNSKVFISVNLKDVLQHLAYQAGYATSQVDFRVTQSLADMPQCVQAMESNWQFFHRLLSLHGLFYWFESKEGAEILVISDSNLNSPYLERGILQVINSAGMNNQDQQDFVGFMHAQLSQSIYNNAASSAAYGQFSTVASNSQSFFEPCAPSQSQASAQAQNFSNALASLNKIVTLTGNVCDLFAGCSISLDDHTGTGTSSDLMCIAVEHFSTQPSDESSHQGLTKYSCTAHFIERGTPFKPLPVPHQAKPMAFPAKVESLTGNAFIDDNGQYRSRVDFDKTARPITQSSPALQKLALYACQNQPQATGWHFPLVGDSEVLIGCINNDPNHSFIMGFALNSDQPSVVTAANPTHNRLLTAAHNELLFDDDDNEPKVILQTLASEHYFELNAKQSGRQFIEWISQLGTINLHAGKDLCLEAEQNNVQFVIKNNQFIDVKNAVTQQTNNGNINYQSASNQNINGKEVSVTADQELSLVSGRAVKINAQSDIVLKTNNSNLKLNVANGSTFLQTNDSINITGSGQGDLIIHNAGGEIKLDRQGNATIIATNVLTLDSNLITFDGPVDYDIESPQTASSPSASNPASISRINNVNINDSGVAATTASVVDLEYVYQDGSPVQNAPYTITFDDGTQATGQLDGSGKAQLTNIPNGQFSVKYGEDSRDFQPEDNTTPNPLYGQITTADAVQMINSGNTAKLEEAGNLANQAGDWLWGTLQGDFNKNPSTSQIVVGTIISMIPVVDQIMDIRDICANTMLLTDDDKANDSDGWIAFTLTAIGLIPLFGSAVKGVGKVVIKNSGESMEAAIAVLRKLGKGDPVKYLREINWQDLGKQAASEVKAVIKGFRDTLQEVSTSWKYDLLLPDSAIDGMQAMVKQLDEVTPQIDQGVKNAATEIGNRVNKALDEFEPPVNTGVVGKPKKTVANELEAPEGNDLKGAKSKESKQISNSLLIEKYANEFSTLSRKDFRTWKIKLANEGLSSSEIQDAIYFGSLKSGKNMWGDNWKKYYEEISGTKYPGPPNHAHHLVEKKGGGKYGVANRKILEDVGINPLLSRENFAWAPNIKGQHGLEPQAQLNEMLNTSQGNKKAILKVLEQWATISKGRTI